MKAAKKSLNLDFGKKSKRELANANSIIAIKIEINGVKHIFYIYIKNICYIKLTFPKLKTESF